MFSTLITAAPGKIIKLNNLGVTQMRYEKETLLIVFMLTLLITGIFPGHGSASATVKLLKSQSVYVPIYSHIYHGDKERPFNLAVTLSIRNTDLKQEITLLSVDYFDSDGNLLRNYVQNIKMKKLATIRYVIKSSDKRGGSGAKP